MNIYIYISMISELDKQWFDLDKYSDNTASGLIDEKRNTILEQLETVVVNLDKKYEQNSFEKLHLSEKTLGSEIIISVYYSKYPKDKQVSEGMELLNEYYRMNQIKNNIILRQLKRIVIILDDRYGLKIATEMSDTDIIWLYHRHHPLDKDVMEGIKIIS